MTRIIGHRGARNLWAENSLGGFRRTAQLGVDAVELDLHLSQDGEIVVIHDPLLERTTNGHGPVSDHSLEALTRLRLRDTIDETIPTLAQVLDLFEPTRARARARDEDRRPGAALSRSDREDGRARRGARA